MLKSNRQKFKILLITSSFLYASLFLFNPLRKILDDRSITLQNNELFWLLIIILLVNFWLYIYLYKKVDFSELNFKKIFKYYIFFNCLLLFIWPLTSSDIFSYIYQGRIFSIYGDNPYLNTYSQYPQDAFYNLINNRWAIKTAPYGPLFINLSGLLTLIGKSSLWLSVYLFKLIFIGAHLLTSYLIYKLSNLKTFWLYAFNPLIILEFVITGHNDTLIALAVVAVIYFLKKGQMLKNHLLAWLLIVMSATIKQTTIILWPILGLLLLKENYQRGRTIKFLISAILITALILLGAYGPFLENLKIIYQPIIDQGVLLGSYSLGILILAEIIKIFSSSSALNISLIINKLIFVGAYLINFIKNALTKNTEPQINFSKYGTWVLAAFYLTSLTWLMPWYFTTLIILSTLALFLTSKKIYLNIVYFFTFYGIIYYIILR